MQNKRSRPRAIDNFIPTGASSQQLGGRRPAQRFPDVGVTMSPYRPYRSNSSFGAAAAERRAVAAATDKRRRHGRRKWHWTKKRVILAALLPFLLIVLWLGIKFGFNAARIFNGNIFSIFSTTQLKGEDIGRVNFLLAGNSADDKGHNGAQLTDSIMIFSLDTRNHRGFLLSVPRDLYVNIDGYGYSKINKAYDYGQQTHFAEAGYPNGGMGLLEKTIEENLGVKTQYYALVNYSALRDAVNAVGGVDITIQSSNPRGLYDPSIDYSTGGALVNLSNGRHHLNGRQALVALAIIRRAWPASWQQPSDHYPE